MTKLEQAEQEPAEKEIAAAVLDHCYGYSAVNDDMIERTSVVVKKILDKHAAPQPVQEDHDGHWSDCSMHNEPAYPNGPCDCGGYPPKSWKCVCGANLYIDSNGAPASKAEQVKQEDKDLVAQMNIDVGLKQKVYEALAEQAEQEPIGMILGGELVALVEEYKTGAWPIYAAHVQQAEHEPFDMNDHPPHRLCECRKCMEYFTPLPDCDAFAAFGKPIAEQTNTQLMEGYRIGLAEMREACAKVAAGYDATPWKHCQTSTHAADMVSASIAAAIRAINFEGDTGFRPVSEMIAEHKQDPKKAAAIEKAKMRKAEQEPVIRATLAPPAPPEVYQMRSKEAYEAGWWEAQRQKAVSPIAPAQQAEQEPVIGAYEVVNEEGDEWSLVYPAAVHKYKLIPEERITQTFYAAPVPTKDLTKEEIQNAMMPIEPTGKDYFLRLARAVIAKFKEKNRA